MAKNRAVTESSVKIINLLFSVSLYANGLKDENYPLATGTLEKPFQHSGYLCPESKRVSPDHSHLMFWPKPDESELVEKLANTTACPPVRNRNHI